MPAFLFLDLSDLVFPHWLSMMRRIQRDSLRSTPFGLHFILTASVIFSLALVTEPCPLSSAGTKPIVSDNIVIDQFGYAPEAQKVAVVRDPRIGFDAIRHFAPGESYALEDVESGEQIYVGKLTPWHNGAVDGSSGDRAFWFDFSPVRRPGRYYVHDLRRNVRSFAFLIADDVYRDVLKHAVRAFFYQRAGFDKGPNYAGASWADSASHLGPGQDRSARLFSTPNDPGSERDLSGGWYDAGDYNRYTNWAARNVITLLKAYRENPAAFTDDYGIPESGNGLPDVIDEAKWGMKWLERMQSPDGSVLSVLGVSHASPPSAAKGPSYYGPASTSATLSAAAAFAFGSTTFRKFGDTAFAADLLVRAERAYRWSDANPIVLFKNNDPESGTEGLAAGQQEVDDYARLAKKVEACVYLFEATENPVYRSCFDSNYGELHLLSWRYASPFEAYEQDMLLHYTRLPGATPAVAIRIRDVYSAAMNSPENLRAISAAKDPYRAYIGEYTWGSNLTKALQGNMFYAMLTYGLAIGAQAARAKDAGLGYLNYLHGVNPFGIVYLTNMSVAGAEKSAKTMFHNWFGAGNRAWGRVGAPSDGPPPGFVVGGPNPSYTPDSCCPNRCGIKGNALCISETISPPMGQPPQKSYKDFDADWPLNSWEVTENSNGYQAAYIRLLSKFVN
jgi:hypothetical protein